MLLVAFLIVPLVLSKLSAKLIAPFTAAAVTKLAKTPFRLPITPDCVLSADVAFAVSA